ncbi:MAG: M23 family metallopeptidase [Candidatus Paracaedibacteraceae bacterium]|nr:M23 family metallopeptidase [Candidatus Paracaedibacteraceae bacterium]
MKSFTLNLKTITPLALVLLLSACSNRSDGPSEIIHARPISPYYIVKADDTLADIASKNSMTESELISLNNLKEPFKVFKGQRILVRVIGSSSDYTKANGDITVKELEADGPLEGSDATPMATIQNPNINESKDSTANTSEFLDPLDTTKAPEIPASKPSFKESLSKEPEPQAAIGTSSFDWPVKGKVLNKFGQKMPDGTISDSIQISAPVDTKVKAAAVGKVQQTGEVPGFGKIVVIKHNDGRSSVYTYLKEVSVKSGQQISQGQVVGRVGKNGNKAMLLFQVRKVVGKKSIPIDPLALLP